MIYAKESHPSWRGSHNSVKSKVLLQLYAIWEHGDNQGLCLKEIVKLTKCNIDSLRIMLPKWVEWHYLRRDAKVYDNRPQFAYAIDQRGRHFVEDRIPPGKREEFIRQIKDARAAHTKKQ